MDLDNFQAVNFPAELLEGVGGGGSARNDDNLIDRVHRIGDLAPEQLLAIYRQSFMNKYSPGGQWEQGREDEICNWGPLEIIAMSALPARIDFYLYGTFVEAFDIRSTSSIHLHYGNLADIAARLQGLVTFQDMWRNLTSMARTADSRGSIDAVYIHSGMALAACVFPVFQKLQTVVAHIDSDDGAAAFTDRLLHVPTITNLSITGLTTSTYRMIGPILPTIRGLSSCRFGGATDGEGVHIEIPDDCIYLQQHLAAKATRAIRLNAFIFSSKTTRIFCNAIAQSQLFELGLVDVSFPASMAAEVVQAILAAPIAELIYSSLSHQADSLFIPLCRALSRSHTIKKLTLANGIDKYIDSSDVAGMCFDYKNWKIDNLCVSVKNWKPDFERFIVNYLKRNALKSIRILFPSNFDGPMVAPNDVLAGVNSRRCSLEAFSVSLGDQDITDTWCAELNSILTLNHQSRIHGDLFQSISQAALPRIGRKRTVQALEAVDVATLYGFLRRNEFHILQLIMQFAVEEVEASLLSEWVLD